MHVLVAVQDEDLTVAATAMVHDMDTTEWCKDRSCSSTDMFDRHRDRSCR